jgi:hypothetical protein
MNQYESALRALKAELNSFGAQWALVGGFAASARGSGRSTTDIDVVAAVVGDSEAESLVYRLTRVGYEIAAELEQEATSRLSTVRLVTPHAHGTRILVDLIFSTTGIEAEVVSGATTVEVFRSLPLPVASAPHLIAMKVLSYADHRPNDLWDIATLLDVCDDHDLAKVRTLLRLIDERGYARGKDLQARLNEALHWAGERRSPG